MKFKVSKKKRFLLAAIGIASLSAVAIGVAVPFASTSVSTKASNVAANDNTVSAQANADANANANSVATTQANSSDFSINRNGTITTDSLVFSSATSVDQSLDGQNTVVKSKSVQQSAVEDNTVSTASTDNTTKVIDKWTNQETVTTVSGKQASIKVSTVYQNKRVFMPILAYDDATDYYGYNNSRNDNDFWYNQFPGWQRSDVKVDTYSSEGYLVYKFDASDVLKSTFKDLKQTSVKLVEISLAQLQEINKDNITDAIKKILDENKDADYVQIRELSDANINLLPDLSSYTNIKKLDLLGLVDGWTTLGNLKMPASVEELSIYAPDMKSIDPLQLPEKANMIYDLGNGATFDVIDLSSHKNLTTQDLQKAVNIVYSQRIKERAFQSNFAGGYIYQWNLRNTGISSFNDVTIPTLDDGTGRFYIDYVAVETSDSNGVVNETVSNSNQPSNDSRIGEWYDWNQNGWAKVESVVVNVKNNEAISAANFDNVVNEIVSFLKKYTNVKSIDISGIKLEAGKSLTDMKDALTKLIDAKYTDPMTGVKPDITIVTEKTTK
ncbi:MAG: IgG-blocking protein M [Malacoplasma sp.]|nr:IgG-blocking protein M [Malacoplasma sp.]